MPLETAAFLSRGGDIGALIQQMDWSDLPLGPPLHWPAALKTTMGTVLTAKAQIVLFWGPDYIALYNDAYAPTIGQKHPDALGRPARIYWAELWDDLEPLLASVRSTGETVHAKDRPFFINRHGFDETVYFDISYSPVFETGGDVGGVLCIVNETTERVLSEQRLRESEARFQAISNSIDQMVWSTRPDGFHDYFNDRWYAFTGVPVGSTDGEGWNDIFHAEDRDRAWQVWRHSLETGAPYQIEYRLRHHSGTYRWVLGRAQPVRDENGQITRWYGTCTDIQEIVNAREVMVRSQEALEQAVAERTAELMAAETRLRQAQKMEAVGQLTGGIAHDFNNMLAVIISGLNLLQRRLAKGDTNVAMYIEGALDGAKRAAALTQRLLAFARQQPLAPEVIDANLMVTGMNDLLAHALGETVTLEIVRGAGLWQSHVDPSELENALINLAVNARDAMPSGGKVTIETANTYIDEDYGREHEVAPGQYVQIAVTDTGIGMAPEVLARAFDPFFTTKSVGHGTGLGLSQVFGFVRQSGGHVKIYSEPDVGTCVKIYLPRHYGSQVPHERRPGSQHIAAGMSGEVVLVVEDDERVRRFSTEALRDLGYEVLEAGNGQEALAIIDGGAPITLLFTDIVMPGMTGRQLADLALARRPGLKVLYTTGYTRNAVVHNGVLDPGTQLLQKPFTLDLLAAKVRAVIDGQT